MARTGRPQSQNPLKYDIKVRLDEETYTKLNEACEASGNDRAAFIRDALRNQLGIETGAGANKKCEKKIPSKGNIKSSMPGKRPLTKDVSVKKQAVVSPKAETEKILDAGNKPVDEAPVDEAPVDKAPVEKTHAEKPVAEKKLDVWLM